MKTLTRACAIIAISMMVAACQQTERAVSEIPQPSVVSQEPADARRAIVAWLECDECTEGQLEAVQRLGERAVPTLATALLEGPSPVRMEELREHLTALYRQQVEYARTHPNAAPKLSEAQYIALYSGNLLAQYQTRAAIALQRIGGAQARDAIQRALRLQLREDVRAAINDAANRIR